MSSVHQPPGGVWTYEEYMKLPVEGTRYEVIAGELYITPIPPLPHQEVLGSFVVQMYGWVYQNKLGRFLLGPVDVLFSHEDFIEPDLVYVRRDRREIITDRAIEGVPDLIVECVAPDTAERDRGLKRERYARFGVPEYWVIDAEARTVEIYRTGSDSQLPEVVTGRWTWQPMPDGPVLELDLPELLEGYDELMVHIEQNERRRPAGMTTLPHTVNDRG
jgi:Uma2 family endonuclease